MEFSPSRSSLVSISDFHLNNFESNINQLFIHFVIFFFLSLILPLCYLTTKNKLRRSLIIFPRAGPDVKYFLGFLRTQLSTTTTIVLVFGPKVLRVLRGQGDQWDNRARVRGITASFSLNGIGLVPEDSPDLYQENEELKVCISKNVMKW